MTPTTNAAARLRHFQIRIFASTWLSYTGFYFCRHAFYIAKPDLTTELGFSAEVLGDIGIAYLIAYTAGQFVSAALGERIGARLMLLLGMGISIGCNVAFGFVNNPTTFMAFMALNGLAQATGWGGNVGTMARWFHRRQRGTVMGFWATCYQVGGALAKGFAAFMLGLWGFQWSFFGASIVLGVVWSLFLLWQRNQPEDVGLPPIPEDADEAPAAVPAATAATERRDGRKRMLLTITVVGLAYFFIKFVRYTLWSWSAYFLKLNFGLETANAGFVSAVFDICGFLGVIAAGVLSDRLFRGRRTQMSVLMLFAMTVTAVLMWQFGGGSLAVFTVCMGVIGFTLSGPDSLLSGAGAIDAGEGRHAIAAAAVINGLGSFGAVAQDKFVGLVYDPNVGSGNPAAVLDPILFALAVSAGLACALIILLWYLARRGLSRL